MQDISFGRVLPAASRAERPIGIASKGHCTAHAVLGHGTGQRVQAESSLELSHLLILNADPSIVELREQVRFRYGPADEREHIFDIVAVRTSGARIAYTVKPEARLRSGCFLTEMGLVVWWVREKRFADDLRLLTDADVDPIDLHNARIVAAVRDADPEADAAAGQATEGLVGGLALRLHAQLWVAARRALRTTSPQRRRWEEDVVAQAIANISAMNTQRSLQFRLIEHGWDAARVKNLEDTLFGSFEVTATLPKTRARPDGHGVSILPAKPDDLGEPIPGSFAAGFPSAPGPGHDSDDWTFDDEEPEMTMPIAAQATARAEIASVIAGLRARHLVTERDRELNDSSTACSWSILLAGSSLSRSASPPGWRRAGSRSSSRRAEGRQPRSAGFCRGTRPSTPKAGRRVTCMSRSPARRH